MIPSRVSTSAQEEIMEHFLPDHELIIRPGSDNFFSGSVASWDTPVAEAHMVAAVRQFYASWRLGAAEESLSHIASPKLRIKEPMWEVAGSYLPVNRVEASMWMERKMKNAGGSLAYEPKAIAHAEGTNIVCLISVIRVFLFAVMVLDIIGCICTSGLKELIKTKSLAPCVF
jgi:hypothetical protein